MYAQRLRDKITSLRKTHAPLSGQIAIELEEVLSGKQIYADENGRIYNPEEVMSDREREGPLVSYDLLLPVTPVYSVTWPSDEARVEMLREDANNYHQIISLLGMEEEGDPVAAVGRLYTRIQDLKTEQVRLYSALRRLSFAAQTSGGVAGRDPELYAAIQGGHAALARTDDCCNQPDQCWEPCGDLGKSEAHAKPVDTEDAGDE